ncbi:MAG: aminotransferase class IV [Anaerolineae bacterium]|nr:aminotransferase class IV [Anaerolineae bacterium]
MSSCVINFLTPDGLQPAPYHANSLADAVQYEPHDGVYTLANTFNHGQVLKLDAHLDRLEDSARRINIPLKLNRTALREALWHMILQSGYDDVRYRITVPHDTPDRIILSIEPFSGHPAEIYKNGVRAITLPNVARGNPVAKTTAWMHDRDSVPLPPGIFTGLLINDDGNILEGTSSNFYAILNGELRTAGAGVLPGIAQQIIFEIAPSILPVKREAANVIDIPLFTEAFISGSSRGIVPVVEIDGITLGDGHPGPLTQKLSAAYAAWMQSHLETLENS